MTAIEVVAALRQALRPIDDEGQQHGGPDGWSPTAEEIGEWEESFREAANPLAIRTLLDAHASALRDAEKLREAVSRLLVLARMANWEGDDAAVFGRAALDDNTKGAAE